MGYKIAIVGSLNTGKTTLAKKLAEEFHIPLAERITSADRIQHLYKGKDVNELNSKQIVRLAVQLYKDRFVSEMKREFVSDGSAITDLARAYTLIGDYEIPSFIFRIYNKLHEMLIKRYNHVFYLHISDIPVKNETVPYLHLRENIDGHIRLLLDKHNIWDVRLDGTLDERLDSALRYLKKKVN